MNDDFKNRIAATYKAVLESIPKSAASNVPYRVFETAGPEPEAFVLVLRVLSESNPNEDAEHSAWKGTMVPYMLEARMKCGLGLAPSGDIYKFVANRDESAQRELLCLRKMLVAIDRQFGSGHSVMDALKKAHQTMKAYAEPVKGELPFFF